ncbi:MAG: glycosyltransferase family 2 protein, partial [Rhodothermales bacterium]|nr:glycosyltransferase family 2 protein [Rhodothermales bacterium]
MPGEPTYRNESSESPKLSVVVPVFNERESLVELAGEIDASLTQAGISYEAILVDDGSTDGSWDVITDIHRNDDRFDGIRFRRNYGKSAALSVGFKAARGEYVATLDGDLQDDPAELPKMLITLESGYDLVSGWKRKRRDPISTKVPSRFFNFVTRTI